VDGFAPVRVNPSLVKSATNSTAELDTLIDQRRNAVPLAL
jgi:hypothetical protein